MECKLDFDLTLYISVRISHQTGLPATRGERTTPSVPCTRLFTSFQKQTQHGMQSDCRLCNKLQIKMKTKSEEKHFNWKLQYLSLKFGFTKCFIYLSHL